VRSTATSGDLGWPPPVRTRGFRLVDLNSPLICWHLEAIAQAERY